MFTASEIIMPLVGIMAGCIIGSIIGIVIAGAFGYLFKTVDEPEEDDK